jgi:hypothetical protein
MGSRADYFRQRATESREQAERSLNHADKEHWLKIAEEWVKMAQEADLAPDIRARDPGPHPRPGLPRSARLLRIQLATIVPAQRRLVAR